ncbi:BCAM0308 family protein [Propionivibrio sp.]|uniref:BCAM0308 family protein n=1 Tax=Propionivibrio sp. TaxID=2212460 RepID=UPI003BF1FDA5
MKSQASLAGFKPVLRDQLRQEREYDTYKRQQKPPEPSACPVCGAIFHAGRWQWGQVGPEAEEVVCPACHRIRDQFPAGFLHVGGPFFATHRGEMFNLLNHHAEKARAEHPLARVMTINEEDEGGVAGILITTTDIHLARDLGEALHHAYQGELEFYYNDAENLLRVHWQR